MLKKIYLQTIALSAVLLTTACDSWLELRPQDGIVQDRFWNNKEQKIRSERMSGDPSKSKSKSLRQMFKRKKNPEQPQQVQYYVGRPSNQKAYHHAAAQVDYGM